jgi:hypothetical protein
MAAEDHNRGRTPSVDPRKVDYSLDDLAKGLAHGTISRLEAVRLMGAALVGGALASVPGFAWAQPERRRVPSSAACEEYCIQVFPAGSERAQCISQGAQGSGPCYECNVANVVLDVRPFAGPNFQCPPHQVFEPNPETGTCCHECGPNAIACPDGGEARRLDCYVLPYDCQNGGTFDASNCQCICPPGTVNCFDFNGAPGRCANLQTDRDTCGSCDHSCQTVSQTAVCVNGVCVEPA